MKHSLFAPLLFLAIGCGKPEPIKAPAARPDSAESIPAPKKAAAVRPEIRYYAFAG